MAQIDQNQKMFKYIIEIIYKLKYGVVGSIKPPLGHYYLHRKQTLFCKLQNLSYKRKIFFWKLENEIYSWTGLDKDWERWYISNCK